MKRVIPIVAFAALAGGCASLPGLQPKVPVGTTSVNYQTGQGQNTQILVQRFQNVEFVGQDGNVLDPIEAATTDPSKVQLLAGDFEALSYNKGVLQYAQYAHESDAQPYVVERKIDETEFETLDKTFYQDNIFKNTKVLDPQKRLPLYFITYVQNGKGWQGSFAPSLTTTAAHVGQLVDSYFNQFDGGPNGDTPTPKGVTQTAYYLSAVNGTMTLALATQTADDSGQLNETPIKLKSVTVNAGQGAVSATVGSDEKSCTFPQPSGKGPFETVDVTITADGAPGNWESLIPLRPKAGS